MSCLKILLTYAGPVVYTSIFRRRQHHSWAGTRLITLWNSFVTFTKILFEILQTFQTHFWAQCFRPLGFRRRIDDLDAF